MKKLPEIFLIALASTSLLPPTLLAQTAVRRNVRIEVGFKSMGFTREGFSNMQHQSQEKQMLLVTDGLEGKLFIGREVPYVTWYQNYLAAEGYIPGPLIFRNVGTSLLVKPRIIGNQIEVTLTPEVSYETQDGQGTIAVTKLSTTVIVPDGEPIEIGAGVQETEFESNFYRRESGEAVRVILTPRVMET